MYTQKSDITSYVTKDGSSIIELMHPDGHGVMHQSLAQATVPPGVRTAMHYHQVSEELYHILDGTGLMYHGDESFTVIEGNTVCIPPGTHHCIENSGSKPLIIMCSCAPAYSHEDTFLV